MKSSRLCILLGVALALLLPTAALAITVIVNDQPLPPYPPPVQRQGRVMLPMRVVFEALGAEVKWEAATRTAIGIRGDVTVRMTINSNIASINDRSVMLDVPPQLLGGSTYMPVRFPAEAFGADVGWHGPTQTVTISLPPLEEAPPPQPPTPPQPPPPPEPQPQPGTVTGVVSAVMQNQLAAVVDEQIQIFTVAAGTMVLRNNQQVPLGELHAGDQVQVTHDGRNNAFIVRASYQTIEGNILAKVPNQLLLDSHPADLLQVQPQVEVVTSEGQAWRYADLSNGDRVVAHITPGTNNVFKIVLRQPEQPPQEPPPPAGPQKPVIDQFYHDADQPLKDGDVLRVTLEGTPGGAARFSIGDVLTDIPMNESRHRPGRYDAAYHIPANINALGVPLVGHLAKGPQAADPAQSAEPITVDTVPPEVQIFGPQQDERTTNQQPSIAVLITDENSSGVDLERSTVSIRAGAQDHPLEITRQGQLLTVAVALPLPRARIVVTVDAYDLAGTHVSPSRAFFVVGAEQAPAAASVSHDAVGVVLTAGDEFTVTATGPPGGQATFDLGEWQQGITIEELADQPGTYQGTFVAPEMDEDRQETLTLRLQTADGHDLTAEAPSPIRFGPARLLQPQLTSPIAGAHVGEQVVIEGTTQPLAEVTCIVEWEGKVWILPVAGQLAEARVTADEAGHFQTEPISLQLELKAKQVKYTISCTARNPRGEESEPTIVEFLP